MANVEKLIPHLIKWEAGCIAKAGESNESLFERAKKTGFSNDPVDTGGATMIGVTLTTYEMYCRKKGYPRPTVLSLRNISYPHWRDIVKSIFWDRWQADKINNQSIADILVDWVWASGSYGITIPQRVLEAQSDGTVGPKTLEAVNSANQEALFNQIVTARKKYIDDIIRNRPANARFKTGWLNRINSFKYA